jgi:hypothetical protein
MERWEDGSFDERQVSDLDTARLALRWSLGRIRELQDSITRLKGDLQEKAGREKALEIRVAELEDLAKKSSAAVRPGSSAEAESYKALYREQEKNFLTILERTRGELEAAQASLAKQEDLLARLQKAEAAAQELQSERAKWESEAGALALRSAEWERKLDLEQKQKAALEERLKADHDARFADMETHKQQMAQALEDAKRREASLLAEAEARVKAEESAFHERTARLEHEKEEWRRKAEEFRAAIEKAHQDRLSLRAEDEKQWLAKEAELEVTLQALSREKDLWRAKCHEAERAADEARNARHAAEKEVESLKKVVKDREADRDREHALRAQAEAKYKEAWLDKAAALRRVDELKKDLDEAAQRRVERAKAAPSEPPAQRRHETPAPDRPGPALPAAPAPAGQGSGWLAASLDNLVFGLAHQVRTPLAVMRSFAESQLSRRWITREQRQTFEAFLRSVQTIGQRLDVFVELCRPVNLRAKETDVAALVDKALVLVSEKCRHQKIQVKAHKGDPVPAIRLDAEQLTTAFLHILFNAIEAMPQGGELAVRLQWKPDTREAAVIFKDSGPGISKDVLQEMEKPFFSTKSDGLGLGLTLTRKILKAHGGDLELSSEPAAGTQAVCRFREI